MTRWLSRAWLAGAGLFLCYNLLLLTDHHRIRVSLVDIRETADAEWVDRPPSALQGTIRFETAASVAAFQSPVPLPAAGDGPPTVRALELFRRMTQRVAATDPAHRCWNAESPQLIAANLVKRNCRGFCADYAILMAAVAQSAGFPARRVVMEGSDGLGGGTHVVTELWLEDLDQWVMMDLSYFTMARDAAGRYLSTLEMRRLLLGGAPGQVTLEQFTQRGALMTAAEVLDYYPRRIADIQYPSNSNLLQDHQASALRRAVSAAEDYAARWGSSAMMLPRFAGRLAMTRSRFRLVDDLNPSSYSPGLWFVGYRLWIGALVLGLLAMVALRPFASRTR